MFASSVQSVVACNATAPRVCTLVLFIIIDIMKMIENGSIMNTYKETDNCKDTSGEMIAEGYSVSGTKEGIHVLQGSVSVIIGRHINFKLGNKM